MDKVEISDGGDEPTMEDILSSIRKIIAEDKTSEEEAIAVDGEGQPEDNLELEADEDVIDIEDILQIPEIEDTSADIVALSSDEALEIDDANDSDAAISELDNESEDILELMEFVEDSDDDPQLALDTIIADDVPASVAPGTIDELELDMVVLEQPEQEVPPVASEGEDGLSVVIDEDVSAPETIVDFDESLDLVMESDASDYLKTAVDTKSEAATDWKDKVKSAAAGFGAGAIISNSDKDDVLQASADEFVPEENVDDEVVEEGAIANSQPNEDFDDIQQDTTQATDTTDDAETLEDVSGKTDEDLDLVKSLLADLMDEEHADGDVGTDDQFDGAEPEISDAELQLTAEPDAPATILDEILDVNIEDEISLQDAPTQDVTLDQIAIDEDVQENIAEAENGEGELARIARKATDAAAQDTSADILEDDTDVISLPAQETSKDFALLAGVVAAGVGIGTLSTDDDKIADLVSEIEPQAEPVAQHNDEPEMEALIGDAAIDEPTDQLQEEAPMVRIVKTETLLGDDTEKDTTDAFASLSNVVQEQADLAENGPAIGELVQEALKPMLQEWLDKNLKGIVTRAVTKEIKRISSTK